VISNQAECFCTAERRNAVLKKKFVKANDSATEGGEFVMWRNKSSQKHESKGGENTNKKGQGSGKPKEEETEKLYDRG